MKYDACVMRNTISKKCVKLVDITILRYFSDSDQFELPVLMEFSILFLLIGPPRSCRISLLSRTPFFFQVH